MPDATGRLGYVQGEDNVEQSLRLLLLTQIEERVMRPDFGTEAPRLVFAPGSSQYLGLLETTVREAIRDWEPRVDFLAARAEADPEDETHIQVSVDYRIRQSNTKLNLVFPFYLRNVAVP